MPAQWLKHSGEVAAEFKNYLLQFSTDQLIDKLAFGTNIS